MNKTKLVVLSITCGVLQIVALIAILAHQVGSFTYVLAGIGGFAGFVQWCILDATQQGYKTIIPIAAICGVGISVIALFAV